MEIKDNLDNDDMCFACGQKNPISLKLDFNFYDDNKVKADFIPDEKLQGFKNIIHGGIISTVLDEAMAKVLNMKDYRAVTAEVKTRFKKPVPIQQKYTVKGIFNRSSRNLLFTEAYLEDEEGTILAEAKAKFMNLD